MTFSIFLVLLGTSLPMLLFRGDIFSDRVLADTVWVVVVLSVSLNHENIFLHIDILLLQICAGPRVQAFHDSMDAQLIVPRSSFLLCKLGKQDILRSSAQICLNPNYSIECEMSTVLRIL